MMETKGGQPRLRPWCSMCQPAPSAGQLRIHVACCGVCRTDLHLLDGELAFPAHALVPGHEIVGPAARTSVRTPASPAGRSRAAMPSMRWPMRAMCLRCPSATAIWRQRRCCARG